MLMSVVRSAFSHKDLLAQLVRRNISIRYKGSALGVLWSFIHPLMMLTVYTFVFGVLYKAKWPEAEDGGIGSFAVMMFCGMSVYNIFSESIVGSSMLIVGNPNFVKKVIFPLEVLPVAHVLASFVFGMAWLLLLFIGALAFFSVKLWTMLFVPVTLLPLFLLSLGLAFFVSSMSVYVRDTAHAVNVLLQVLFFATPIFYSTSVVPNPFKAILFLNPLTTIVEQTRRVMFFGRAPEVVPLVAVYAVCLAVFAFGQMWFGRTKKGFADVL